MMRFILTGTPGSGKTALIRRLDSLGYNVVDEAATDVIKEEQALGNLIPWAKPDFLEKITLVQIQRRQQPCEKASPYQFFDRSPLCTLALANYLGFEPPQSLKSEIALIKKEHLYEPTVFFIENLGHCEQTEARKISFQEALRFEEIHKAVYHDHGVGLVTIPNQSIENRIQTILSFIAK